MEGRISLGEKDDTSLWLQQTCRLDLSLLRERLSEWNSWLSLACWPSSRLLLSQILSTNWFTMQRSLVMETRWVNREVPVWLWLRQCSLAQIVRGSDTVPDSNLDLEEEEMGCRPGYKCCRTVNTQFKEESYKCLMKGIGLKCADTLNFQSYKCSWDTPHKSRHSRKPRQVWKGVTPVQW